MFDPSVNEILVYIARQVAQIVPLRKEVVSHCFSSPQLFSSRASG